MALFKTFGKNPSREVLDSFAQYPNFTSEGFQNLSATEMMLHSGAAAMLKMSWRFFNKPANTRPSAALPAVKQNLEHAPSGNPVITWFGHSSYLLQVNGKNILVDPVFSGYASPFNFGVKSFEGSDIYSAADMPVIDLLLITHDHFDHLDHRTVLKLKPKVKNVLTSVGVDSHLVHWGFDPAIISTLYWWQSKMFFNEIEITAAPARHFSGRTFNRNKTLWSSFIVKTNQHNIYLGADSGYDSHFKIIGEKAGPFDIAILESGQYNSDWPLIHMMPEETVQAAADLGARLLLPVHWGKFALAFHPWNEPVERVLIKAAEMNINVTTPMIGEQVIAGKLQPQTKWWHQY